MSRRGVSESAPGRRDRFARVTFDGVEVTGPAPNLEARLQELLDASFLHI
jgi:hypothetical protein